MGSRKKTKIGTRYYYGVCLVALRVHDALIELELNDKRVFRGQKKSGRVNSNATKLFGGDEREGGFSGAWDIQDGNVDQPINDYMDRVKSSLTGGMRGVVSFVFRKTYWSANTARLPKIRSKHGIIKSISRGWNEIDEVIDTAPPRNGDMYYFAYDLSNVLTIASEQLIRNGLAQFIRSLKGTTNSVRVVAQKRRAAGSIFFEYFEMTRYDCTDQDYEDLALYVLSTNTSGDVGGSNPIDLSTAADFFSRGILATSIFFFETILGALLPKYAQRRASLAGRRYIFIMNGDANNADIATDAAAQLAALPSDILVGVVKFQIGSGEYVDNGTYDLDTTAISGVSFPLTNDETATAIKKSIGDWFDVNPAHGIRCLWTDPMRTASPVSVDEMGDSFDAFSDLMIAEGFGMSMKFRGTEQANADRLDIERHVDAMSFRSNRTGKIEVRAVRDDYTIGDLLTLDNSIVTDWSGLSRAPLSEIANQLTVKYMRRDGKTGGVTRQNPAAVRRDGRVIPAKDVSYMGVTTRKLAISLCLRDLGSVSTNQLSGSIEITYLPKDIEPASVVILNNPLLGINNVVMRVTETRVGSHDKSNATLYLIEDKYATAQVPNIEGNEDEEALIEDIREALPVAYRLVTEAPYIQGVFAQGQAAIDDELALEPDLGRLLATGAKADGNQLEATLATSTGSDIWLDEGLVDFEPYGVLVNGLAADASVTTFLVTENETLDEINEGDLARLGTEIIRIDDLADQGDGTFLVTVGRGCLDGPVQDHAPGDAFVLNSVVDALATDYIAGQTVLVRMLSATGEDEIPLSEAEEDTVVFGSRAIRPYNVGDLKVDASYVSSGIVTGDVTLTWKHRDRTFQTTPAVDDFTADSIGPETAVFYETVRQDLYRHAAFFEAVPLFGRRWFFVDETVITETLVNVSQLLTGTVNVDVTNLGLFDRVGMFDPPLMFNNELNSTALVRVGVKTSRTDALGTYENWITPLVSVRPLLPVFGLTLEEV